MEQGREHERSGRTTSKRSGGERSKTAGKTSRATQVGEAAQQAGRQAREAASSLAALATEEVKRVADRQMAVGADAVLDVATSVRAAADSLDETIPQLGTIVRGTADRMEEFADTIRDQSIGELSRAAAEFARRRPAIVLGAAAACGFLLFRLFKATPANGYGQDEDEADFASTSDWDDIDAEEEFGTQTTGGQLPGTGQQRAGDFNAA
jgi:ElaB/YqjD/DUF883 family membrane-anchored ribosome-binding protein